MNNQETKRELREVLDAIKDSDGIKTLVAKRLGVTRVTLDKYLKKWKMAREALDDESRGTSDYARSLIVGNLRAAYNAQNEAAKNASKEAQRGGKPDWAAAVVDSSDAKWWLTMKEKGEFSQRHEHTGAEGGDVVIRIINDR